jgi:hypothetical protein
MSRGIAEERSCNTGKRSSGGVHSVYGFDKVVFGISSKGKVIEVEVDIVLGANDLLF